MQNFCPNQTNTWNKPTPYGLGSYNDSGYWYDQIYYFCSNGGTTCVSPDLSTPQNPLSGSMIDYSTQTWRVGSATVGSGVEVQYDMFQCYVDHGRHNNIVSPVQ